MFDLGDNAIINIYPVPLQADDHLIDISCTRIFWGEEE